MTYRPANYGCGAAAPSETRVVLAHIDHPLAKDEILLLAHRGRGCWRYSFDGPDDWNLIPGRASSREALTFGELIDLFEKATASNGECAYLLWPTNSDFFLCDDKLSMAEQRMRLTRTEDFPRPRSDHYPDLAPWCSDQQSAWVDRYLLIMTKARNGDRIATDG